MSIKDTYERELQVIIHGQSTRFRLIKYAVLLPLFGMMWAMSGWYVALQVVGALFMLALIVHFFYRYRTKSWTQAWGGFVPDGGNSGK